MAAPRDRRHILVPLDRRQASAYTWPKRAIKSDPAPAPASRKVHGDALRALFAQALTEAHARRGAATVEVHGAEPGVYVEFEGRPGATLKLPSLENRAKGIEVVAATDPPETPQEVQRATVFVPEVKTDHFVQRFDAYSTDAPKQKGEHRHEEMLDPVEEIRLSALRGLWTDAVEVYPEDDETIWWEVWLRRTDGRELERFLEYCGAVNVVVNERRLEFDDRIVVLAHASPQQLAMSMDVLQDLGEVRKAKEGAAFFLDLPPAEQGEWADALRERTTPPEPDAPAVALLDTGITRAHPLLEPAVAEADVHTVDPEWGVHDTGPGASGHGTPMMGLALYGDLSSFLAGSTPVRLRYCGESVKILPPDGDKPNDPQMYGTITADATSQVETEAPDRRRCFALAITADDVRDRGRPTSWSAAVDALAAGRSFDATTQGLVYLDDRRAARRRLFVVSAGNMSRELLQVDHLTQSDLRPVQDPAHAWNALTVGAYTDLVELTDPDYAGWAPLAEPGELSPYSTTSVPFADEWPLKPDVVHEGGNLAFRGAEVDWSVPDLSVLTTHARPQQRMFIHFTATSAATAQVARLAAILAAEYPDYEPETIRALIVHSARWTTRMQAQMKAAGGKGARARLVRRYGYGVPNLERALRSAKDALTLVAQGSILRTTRAAPASSTSTRFPGRSRLCRPWRRRLSSGCASRSPTSWSPTRHAAAGRSATSTRRTACASP